MMWIVVPRAPAPDMPYWPGRRWLAVLDAVAWPAVALALLAHVPGHAGIILPIAGAILGVNGLMRLHTALCVNHRYRFTTWRWGRVAILLVLVGAAMKFAILWR